MGDIPVLFTRSGSWDQDVPFGEDVRGTIFTALRRLQLTRGSLALLAKDAEDRSQAEIALLQTISQNATVFYQASGSEDVQEDLFEKPVSLDSIQDAQERYSRSIWAYGVSQILAKRQLQSRPTLEIVDGVEFKSHDLGLSLITVVYDFKMMRLAGFCYWPGAYVDSTETDCLVSSLVGSLEKLLSAFREDQTRTHIVTPYAATSEADAILLLSYSLADKALNDEVLSNSNQVGCRMDVGQFLFFGDPREIVRANVTPEPDHPKVKVSVSLAFKCASDSEDLVVGNLRFDDAGGRRGHEVHLDLSFGTETTKLLSHYHLDVNKVADLELTLPLLSYVELRSDFIKQPLAGWDEFRQKYMFMIDSTQSPYREISFQRMAELLANKDRFAHLFRTFNIIYFKNLDVSRSRFKEFRSWLGMMYQELATDEERVLFFEILGDKEREQYSRFDERDPQEVLYDEFLAFVDDLHVRTKERLLSIVKRTN